MAKTVTKPQEETQKAPATAALPEKKPETQRAIVPVSRNGLQIESIEQAYRFANYLADSGMVPDNYKKKPSDCLVAIDLSLRLGVSWLAVMQNVYPVHGRPGMMSVLVTSLMNSSGLFTDPLDYEIIGTDPEKDDYKVRAFATRKSTGKVLYGPWITWKLVRAEKWDKKADSKWLTMPDQMFCYRAASWFANRHCPEVKMGMMTTEEAEDVGSVKRIESTVVEPGNEGIKKLLAEREAKANGNAGAEGDAPQPPQAQADPQESAEPEDLGETDEQTQAKVAEQKAKLQTAGAGNGGKKSNLFSK